jgi:elongation factor 2
MKYTVSPVVRISVRVKDQSNLQKLVDSLDKLRKTDPLAIISHTDEGEHIIAGSGELHVEILYNDLCDLAGVDVLKDDPIVSYMETINAKSCETCLAKSPNKHNRIFMTAEPMADGLVEKIEKAEIFPSQDLKARAKVLVNEYEWEDDHARKIWSFGPEGTGPNLFVDSTKAIQYLIEIKDHCVSAFQELTRAGPLAFEQQRGVRYSLWDATLHTDSIHRGANQISPATRNAMMAS